MTEWKEAPGTFFRKAKEVRVVCGKNFGPEHEVKRNRTTGRIRDNHGNWELTQNGTLRFRYEKDLLWFLMIAVEYQDVPYKSFDEWLRSI